MTLEYTPHHVAITVSDPSRSISFYSDLGFEEIDSYANEAGDFSINHLRSGNLILELFWFKDAKPIPDDRLVRANDLKYVGCKHLGIQVEDVRGAFDKMRESGYKFDSELARGRLGYEYFFVADPDGMLIEVLHDNR